MSDNIKDDYVMSDFIIGDGLFGADVDRFVYDRRHHYFSSKLEEYIDTIPDVHDGITETGVYTNYDKNRWEYWAVITTNETVGILAGFENSERDFVSFCSFDVMALGFGKWMQEVEEYMTNPEQFNSEFSTIN